MGGILAMEYSLKYQNNMKGLIISNMMASCPEYDQYANEVLSKQMNPEVLAELMKIEANNDFSNPRYMELLLPNFYEKHILSFPSKRLARTGKSFVCQDESVTLCNHARS